MDLVLLDTDMLSELFKGKNPVVTAHAQAYLAVHPQLAISAMTRFEIERGLKRVQASAQLARLEIFCQSTSIFPISDDVLHQAADFGSSAFKSEEDLATRI